MKLYRKYPSGIAAFIVLFALLLWGFAGTSTSAQGPASEPQITPTATPDMVQMLQFLLFLQMAEYAQTNGSAMPAMPTNQGMVPASNMVDMDALMSMMTNMDMPDEMREQMITLWESMGGAADMPGMTMPTTDPHAGMVMPETATPMPEMVHNSSDPMAAGGHGMEPVSSEGVPTATEEIGGQPLEYTLDGDVKVFEITTRPVIWNILPDVTVTAWTYNGTVPGPMIRVTEGDQVRIVVTNELPEPTTIHWHGIEVPNAMDGIPGITQEPIQPGETFTYEFTANPAGTFMYHSHFESDEQVSIGLYAPFIIDPAEPEEDAPDVDVMLMLSEWRVVDGQTYPAMPLGGMEANYFTLNGKAFPATESIHVNVGDRVRIRLAGIGQLIHPMHLHGRAFKIVAIDGFPVPEEAQITRDTINVAPGERYDIEFIATEPGTWILHCHILHHVTNDGVEGGGLMLTINVAEPNAHSGH